MAHVACGSVWPERASFLLLPVSSTLFATFLKRKLNVFCSLVRSISQIYFLSVCLISSILRLMVIIIFDSVCFIYICSCVCFVTWCGTLSSHQVNVTCNCRISPRGGMKPCSIQKPRWYSFSFACIKLTGHGTSTFNQLFTRWVLREMWATL